jgi:hypothetical protein
MEGSAEEVTQIFVGFLGSRRGRGSGLLGLFLLLLLFFGSLLLGGTSSNTSSSGSAGSDFLLSVGDELVEGLALETVDDSIDVVVRDLRSDVSKERLDISSF